MFSRAEREFLTQLAHGPAEEVPHRLARAFPNPVYRRKLLWGIRHKAARSLSDWQLYALAVGREERLLPRSNGSGESSPPLLEDPIVTFLGAVRRLLSPHRTLPPQKSGEDR